MQSRKAVAAGIIAAIMGIGTAQAADMGTYNRPITQTPPQITAYAAPPPVQFSWAGPYIGAYGGIVFSEWYQAGLQAGYNVVRGNFLAGIEAQAGAGIAGPVFLEGHLNARLGFVLGRILVYGEGGVGYIGIGPEFLWTAGGGAEIALGRSISVFGEAKFLNAFGGGNAILAQGGINWHPGY